ncbi:cytochrome c3 family protein [Paracoccus sp. 11-3]|uniref:Cytochrome c3 family protein n=1 Tax=Paracoccus amoyensis TaxID=2760093 RepID=A0A926JBT8_9RHOB|nr:cytochrome c3 family protein [Paracoccus amoyensis]MBC9247466.1 cytochrome c3 family protein [Paracoccus amoyensis]
MMGDRQSPRTWRRLTGWVAMAAAGLWVAVVDGTDVVATANAQAATGNTPSIDEPVDPAWLNRLFEQVAANPVPPAAPVQPLPFNHEWHVTEVGLDCTNCHTNPDPGRLMTFPDTETCMQCHADIATDKEPIQRLTAYHDAHEAVPWVRVYQLLPGVNWSHRTHVDAGVGCLNCHGAVPELQQMRQLTTVTSMASCQSCHQAQQAPNTCVTCHSWPDDRLIRAGR